MEIEKIPREKIVSWLKVDLKPMKDALIFKIN